jgi:hypothetical protein
MSLTDVITFVAAMLFLLITGRQKSKAQKAREEANEVEEDAEGVFYSEESVPEELLPPPPPLRVSERDRDRTVQRGVNGRRTNLPERAKPLPERVPFNASSAKRKHEAQRDEVRQQKNFSDAYAFHKAPQRCRGNQSLKNLKSLHEVIIVHEIISPPKGL